MLSYSFDFRLKHSYLNQFKLRKSGKYFESNTFGINDNFCLLCYPNGYNPERIGNLSFGIKLLKLPNNVTKTTINHSLSAIFKEPTYSKTSKKLVAKLSYNHAKSRWTSNTFKTEWLKNIKTELVFEVNIEITEMYDRNNQSISKEKWSEHITLHK